MDTPEDKRLNSIEERLTRLEKYVSIPPIIKQQQSSTISDEIEPASIDGYISTFKAGNWLGIVAILFFVLAGAFIVKLSVDSGWLTPVRQIGLAYLLGFILIGAGLILINTDRQYASLLPAGGIIILFLTTYSAYQFYGLLSFDLGISITSLISLFCILLYLKFKHDIYAIVAAVGAYISPLYLGYYINPIFTLYYFILCSLAFSIISIWVKSRTLTLVSAYLAIFVNTIIGLRFSVNHLMASILPIHFFIFSIGAYLYTRINSYPLTEKESWYFFPVLTFFYAMEYYFINAAYPGNLASYMSILFAAVLLLLFYAARKWKPEQALNSQNMIVAFATLVFFHAIYLNLLSNYLCAWLFVAITILFALTPDSMFSVAMFTSEEKKLSKTYLVIPCIALVIIIVLEYFKFIARFLSLIHLDFLWFGVSIAAIASLWFLYIKKQKLFTTKDNEFGYGLLIMTHLLVISFLYNISNSHGSLAISLSWLIYAALVMAYGFWQKDKIMANSSLIILSFAGAKVLLYDVSGAPTIVRILCLLVTGFMFYGAGFLFKKIADWPNDIKGKVV